MKTFVRLFFVSLLAAGFSANAADDAPEYVTPEITVLGPGGARPVDTYVPTVSEISGRRLETKKRATIGETLSREAGVSSSFFGPNADRPVIRGLEGERIRVLQNGVGTIDASATSPDHAVSLDPFLVDRVEIVRGSAALLYGNSAVGGVVNTVNSRIPDRLRLDPSLRFFSRYSTVDDGRAAGLALNRSVGNFSLHADGIARAAHDYSVPEARKKVRNSANDAIDGSVGGSYVIEDGYLGLALSGFTTDYGTVANPAVTIEMNRQRLDLAGELKGGGWIESMRMKGALSQYKHTEMEGARTGTIFRNRGIESRFDFKHRPVGVAEGIFGIQQQYSDFSALGTEAFLPPTLSSSLAAFAHEEMKLGAWTPSLGLRLDRSSVKAENDANFGIGARKSFWATSASSGLLYQLDPAFTLGLNATFNERAPNYQELFANGPHVATNAFEVGNREMKKEISRALELSLRHRTREGEGRITGFVQDFERFIALLPQGPAPSDPALTLMQYAPVEARFFGAEFEYRHRLPWTLAGGFFEAEARFDYVRARNRTSHADLPRITPMRETLALNYRTDAFSADIEAQRSERQKRVSGPNETPTAGYTLVNVGGEVPLMLGRSAISLTGRVTNVFDRLGRVHTSYLKDVAPLPGRNFILGLQARL
jgi:iron complex outermembrane receptor protein